MKFLKDIFTGVDGDTYDIGRVGSALGLVSFVVFAGWSVYQGKAFDCIAFGTGYGAVMAASGLGLS